MQPGPTTVRLTVDGLPVGHQRRDLVIDVSQLGGVVGLAPTSQGCDVPSAGRVVCETTGRREQVDLRLDLSRLAPGTAAALTFTASLDGADDPDTSDNSAAMTVTAEGQVSLERALGFGRVVLQAVSAMQDSLEPVEGRTSTAPARRDRTDAAPAAAPRTRLPKPVPTVAQAPTPSTDVPGQRAPRPSEPAPGASQSVKAPAQRTPEPAATRHADTPTESGPDRPAAPPKPTSRPNSAPSSAPGSAPGASASAQRPGQTGPGKRRADDDAPKPDKHERGTHTPQGTGHGKSPHDAQGKAQGTAQGEPAERKADRSNGRGNGRR